MNRCCRWPTLPQMSHLQSRGARAFHAVRRRAAAQWHCCGGMRPRRQGRRLAGRRAGGCGKTGRMAPSNAGWRTRRRRRCRRCPRRPCLLAAAAVGLAAFDREVADLAQMSHVFDLFEDMATDLRRRRAAAVAMRGLRPAGGGRPRRSCCRHRVADAAAPSGICRPVPGSSAVADCSRCDGLTAWSMPPQQWHCAASAAWAPAGQGRRAAVAQRAAGGGRRRRYVFMPPRRAVATATRRLFVGARTTTGLGRRRRRTVEVVEVVTDAVELRGVIPPFDSTEWTLGAGWRSATEGRRARDFNGRSTRRAREDQRRTPQTTLHAHPSHGLGPLLTAAALAPRATLRCSANFARASRPRARPPPIRTLPGTHRSPRARAPAQFFPPLRDVDKGPALPRRRARVGAGRADAERGRRRSRWRTSSSRRSARSVSTRCSSTTWAR